MADSPGTPAATPPATKTKAGHGPADVPLNDPSTYQVWAEETLRYADTDKQGHVNNAVFATFMETGRTQIFYAPAEPFCPPGTSFVVARLTINYLAELLWPGKVMIGTRILKLGNKSMTVGQGIFKGETCVATGENIIVLMDEQTRRGTPFPPALRERLLAL